MKISDGFYVMFLLTIQAIFHGTCRTIIYGSTDFPCEEDTNCLSNLPRTDSNSQKTTSTSFHNDSTPNSSINESLNQSDREIFFHTNTSITLDCPRLGSHKRANGQYRWTKIKPNAEYLVLSEGAELLRRTHLKLTENETYYVVTIRNAKATDAGSYQCTIGDSVIIQTIHVSLIVKPEVTNVEPFSERFLHPSKPNVWLFTLNTNIVLTCWVEGYPKPMVTWFRSDGHPLPDGNRLVSEISSSSFIIDNIQLEHAGKYICYANDSLGQTTEKEMEVIVQFRPSVSAPKKLLRKSLNDEFVTLTCKVNAIPNATRTWLKDGTAIDTSQDRKQLRFPVYCPDDGLMKFVLKTVMPRDYGKYTCLATNQLGNGSSSIILSARPVAPIIISDPMGSMMYEYELQWQSNSTFRLPPVTMFKIQYRLDAETMERDLNLNESDIDADWKYKEYVPRREDSQENVTFNVTLEGLRKNSTYFLYIEAQNAIKSAERGEAAFFQFKTSEFNHTRTTTTASIEYSPSLTSVKDILTKTTSGAVTSNVISTILQKKNRKPSTFHAPTKSGLMGMTPVAEKSNNRAEHNVVSSSVAVLVGVVILCKLLLL